MGWCVVSDVLGRVEGSIVYLVCGWVVLVVEGLWCGLGRALGKYIFKCSSQFCGNFELGVDYPLASWQL